MIGLAELLIVAAMLAAATRAAAWTATRILDIRAARRCRADEEKETNS